MAQYKIGTVSVTNGSATVTGSGTAWLANVSIGDYVVIKDPALTVNQLVAYEVGGVASDTILTLTAPYGGPDASGVPYTVHIDYDAKYNAPKFANGDVETAYILNKWLSQTLPESSVISGFTAKVDSIASLPPATGSGRKVDVIGYHTGTTVGGGSFVDDITGRHNGVTLFDPNRSAEIGTAAYYVDSGVDVACWERVNVLPLSVSMSGARGDGATDDTSAIQATFDVMGDMSGGDASGDAGYIGWEYPAIIFPDGTYLCSTVTTPARFKLRSSGQAVIKSLSGTKAVPADTWIDNAVFELDVDGLTFLYWDDVFIVPTNNADFSFHTIRNCNAAYCNSIIDQVSFALSRSTKFTMDNCRITYGVPRIATIYSDVSEIKDSWLMHTTDTYLFYIDSFCRFENNVIVPLGNDKTNRAVIFFEATDQTRSLVIDDVRFGGEAGQSAIVAIGDVNKNDANDTYRNQGVTIRRTDMASNGNYDPDSIGSVNANVILRTPTSKNNSIQFLSIEDCYAGPDKTGGVVQYYGSVAAKDRLNDDLTINIDRSSSASFTRGANQLVSDDLKPYLATPILKNKYFGPTRETGLTPVLDTATTGQKKVTLDLNITYPSSFLTPMAFEVVLTGQSRESSPNFGYAYTSKYIITLTGIFTAALYARWTYSAVHTSVGGISGDTNADINSVHWGSADTGSADLAISGATNPEQQVTITFGTNMAVGFAYIRPLFDFDLKS